MKGNPEVDMDKIEADQKAEAKNKALGKIQRGLGERRIHITNVGIPKEGEKDANPDTNG